MADVQGTYGEPGSEKSPEQVQEDVRRAREVIKEDIKQLGERLKPDVLKDNLKASAREAWQSAKGQAMEAVSDRGRRAMRGAKSTVATSGAPLLLIGLGAGWLAMSRRKRRMQGQWSEGSPYETEGYEYGATTGGNGGGMVEHARDVASHASDVISEKAEQLTSRAQERAQEIGGQARHFVEDVSHTGVIEAGRERARRAGGTARRMIQDVKSSHAVEVSRDRIQELGTRARTFADENPLAFGAAVIATGIGLGMLLPMSSAENRLMGPARDKLLGRARGLAQEVRSTASRIEDKTRETTREVREALTERNPPH